MTAIAWAIIVSVILIMPEDKGLKIEKPAHIGLIFAFSIIALIACTIRELLR